MVPFIDVMLVLLIIFMVTAPLITPSVIDLPSVGKAARQPDQIVQIVVSKNDSLELKAGDKAVSVTLKDLASNVKRVQGDASAGKTAVVISADRNVKYETVVKVMDTLQRAGIGARWPVGATGQLTKPTHADEQRSRPGTFRVCAAANAGHDPLAAAGDRGTRPVAGAAGGRRPMAPRDAAGGGRGGTVVRRATNGGTAACARTRPHARR